MSESPNVLIAVGQSQDPNIPEQTYENIFTRYNVGGLSGRPDGDFYNQIIDTPSTPKWGDKNFDIYGFMSGACYYTYPNSIQCVVDFFNKNDNIKVVVCDMLYDKELFKFHRYIHPQAPNNLPFFIRSSIVKELRFTNQSEMLQSQLEALKQKYPIFHIAAPLISIREEGSE